MKAFKVIGIILLVLIGGFLLIGIFAPKEMKVERSVSINAPKDVIMGQIVSLKNQNSWSPWKDKDENMKIEFEGEDGKVGAVSRWEGNEDVGKGMQEITNISENRVETKIVFIEPFESESDNYFQIDKTDEAYQVSWGFTSEMPFPWNAMTVFMDMEGEVGKDFDLGLQRLKEKCESMEVKPTTYRGYEISEIDFQKKAYFIYKDTIRFDDIHEFYATHFPAIMRSGNGAGLQPAGAPSGLFYEWNEQEQTAVMAAAIPFVAEEGVELEGYERVDINGDALKIEYFGAYGESGEAHYAMDDYIKKHGKESVQYVLEEYITDPEQEPDTSNWQTNIYYVIGS